MSRRRKPHTISVGDDLWSQVEQEAATTGQSLSQVVVAALSQYFRSKMVRASSWDTDDSDSWYDEAKFYTFSQDKFGHSAKIEVTVPKMVAGEVAGIIDSGKIPELRTAQDFYRNAVRHEAHRIGKMIQEGRLVDASHQMTILDRIATVQAQTTEYDELETRMRDVLDEELFKGRLDFIRAELDTYWDAASTISERFTDQYITLLNEYEDKLKDATGIDYSKYKGQVDLPDGRRFKNGIELQPPKRRKPSTE